VHTGRAKENLHGLRAKGNDIRDYGAPHERLAPGFVVDTKLDGDDRIVTFYTGLVARERLIDIDDGARRLAYSVQTDGLTHHNAYKQVFDNGDRLDRRFSAGAGGGGHGGHDGARLRDYETDAGEHG
jgi:hypothetical protein